MRRSRELTWALLTASLVVGLAALVRLADPRATGADDLSGVIRLPASVTWTIVALFGLAALIFVVDVARRMRSRRHGDEDAMLPREEAEPRPAWLQALTQVMAVVNVVVIVYLLWNNVLPFTDLMALGQALSGAGGGAQEPAADAPFFFTWTFAIVALLGGTGALALALWLASSDRLAKWWERDAADEAPAPLVTAVEESLEDLRAEPDARRAIIRCYARFERAAVASGLTRRPSHTPIEFMRDALSRLPAPRASIRALTTLFELARFSDRPLGAADRDRALDALDAIKAAIDAQRAETAAHADAAMRIDAAEAR